MNMKKLGLICLSILTFALGGISFVPTLFLKQGDRLVWQMSNWTLIFASLFVAFIGVLLTIHYTKGKHGLWKITAWSGCVILAITCLVSFYVAMVVRDEKIWSSKEYVVYSEYDGPIDPHKFVLYKRDGLIDRRMFTLGNIGFSRQTKFYSFTFGYAGTDMSFNNIKHILTVTVRAGNFSTYYCMGYAMGF